MLWTEEAINHEKKRRGELKGNASCWRPEKTSAAWKGLRKFATGPSMYGAEAGEPSRLISGRRGASRLNLKGGAPSGGGIWRRRLSEKGRNQRRKKAA